MRYITISFKLSDRLVKSKKKQKRLSVFRNGLAKTCNLS